MTTRRSCLRRDTGLLILIVAAFASSLSRYIASRTSQGYGAPLQTISRIELVLVEPKHESHA
jgi:hypothetical protein